MMKQKILESNGCYEILDSWFIDNQVDCAMLVCGKSIAKLKINEYIKALPIRLGVKIVHFMDFQSNPVYENVVTGVEVFRKEECNAIIAVGGGSAMDVAKCIKLYSNLPNSGENGSWLQEKIIPNVIPFLVMPTTAGTGAEATRYAVIYFNGFKQSISDYSCIPKTILMDASVLKTLPDYQKKATMMDTLCHAIESFWSINSTESSKEYSKNAIKLVMSNMDAYLSNYDEGNANMLVAANIAGKAINITQTTAGHAMCYKITSIFKCAHGHAAILCNRVLFSWMIDNINKCIDPRGEEYLKKTLDEIGQAMGCVDAKTGAEKLVEIFDKLGFNVPEPTEDQYKELKLNINPVRLKNHPVSIDTIDIQELYKCILNIRLEDNYVR